jgi:hypothetical protein
MQAGADARDACIAALLRRLGAAGASARDADAAALVDELEALETHLQRACSASQHRRSGGSSARRPSGGAPPALPPLRGLGALGLGLTAAT